MEKERIRLVRRKGLKRRRMRIERMWIKEENIKAE
jgi:hypothetical protein